MGMIDRLADLADPKNDTLGLQLEEENLPKRIRTTRQKTPEGEIMDKETLVYVDLDGTAHLVGRLWARVRKNKESATFEYHPAWLENPARFSLEPALNLGPGPFHTLVDAPLFGA
jgi:hypothetical protein